VVKIGLSVKVKDSANGFKEALKAHPGFAQFIGAIKNANSPEVTEELIEISKTHSKLYTTRKRSLDESL